MKSYTITVADAYGNKFTVYVNAYHSLILKEIERGIENGTPPTDEQIETAVSVLAHNIHNQYLYELGWRHNRLTICPLDSDIPGKTTDITNVAYIEFQENNYD
jgi:hypothetical protein